MVLIRGANRGWSFSSWGTCVGLSHPYSRSAPSSAMWLQPTQAGTEYNIEPTHSPTTLPLPPSVQGVREEHKRKEPPGFQGLDVSDLPEATWLSGWAQQRGLMRNPHNTLKSFHSYMNFTRIRSPSQWFSYHYRSTHLPMTLGWLLFLAGSEAWTTSSLLKSEVPWTYRRKIQSSQKSPLWSLSWLLSNLSEGTEEISQNLETGLRPKLYLSHFKSFPTLLQKVLDQHIISFAYL